MNKIIAFFIILLSASFFNISAQDLITNVGERNLYSLDGKWQVLIDPYENGYFDYRLKPDNNGYFKNEKPKNRWDHIEYDFDKSFSLNVPGDWNTQKPELFFYEGTVWYKKSFDYSLNPNSRQFIYFGAVNYQAIVYLNGEKVGEHQGGFTPFNIEVTGKLKNKGNFIVVKADNRRSREFVPTVNTDWWNYGGITRSVCIVEEPETFIQDYHIQLSKGSKTEIAGYVLINGKSKNISVKISIPELLVNKEVMIDKDGYGRFAINTNPVLWSPDNPKLYEVQITSPFEKLKDEIGFRSVEVYGNEILLNGKSLFLRGISIHEEAPIRTGRAFSKEDADILLGWAKELGCNYVRLAHYPHNEYMVKTADKMGILIWSEIPVYWTIEWDNKITLANALKQLDDMICRDKNRCSIILWSVANETPVSSSRNEFLKTLLNRASELDPARLLTAAMERHYSDKFTQLIDDPLGEFVDVIGCNEYIGWYDGLPEKADSIKWKSIYDKPLIMSELGGEALYGFHADDMTAWSEENQNVIYKHQIDMLKKIPFLRGISPWILMDFRSPRRQLTGFQDYFNRKGLVSEKGEKKKAFYTLKKFYEEIKSVNKTN
jgi:beta-glucuronidase